MQKEKKFLSDLLATGNYRVMVSPRSIHEYFSGEEDEDKLIATIEGCEEEAYIRADDAIKFLSFIPQDITVILYYTGEDYQPAVKATRLNGQSIEIKGLAKRCKGENEDVIKRMVFQTLSGMFDATPCTIVPVSAYDSMKDYYRVEQAV